MSSAALAMAEDLARYTHDPSGFMRYAFTWGEGDLQGSSGPRAWQTEINSAIGTHLSDPATRYQPLFIAVASGHGIGKAHPVDLLLDTPDGMRRWGSVQVGDRLFGPQGTVTVKARHDRGAQPVYRIAFDDGSFTLCGADHLWTVRGRQERRYGQKSPVTLSTAEILKRGVKRSNGRTDCRQWEIPTHKAVEYPPRELPVDAYTLGVWLGDGCRNAARITSMDSEVVEGMRVGNTVTCEASTASKANAWYIRKLGAKLRALSLFDKYSYQKSVPESYRYNSAAVRSDILRGLMDTDGEANEAGSAIFNSTSKALAADVIWLARSLGGKAQFQPTVKLPFYPGPDGEKLAGRPCYRVTVTMPDGFQLFNIPRKQERLKPIKQGRYLSRWIDSIEYVCDAESMCVTVDSEDGLYLANDFIVTHNSAEIGMLTNWAMSTCEDCKVVITAGTGTQLATKTVPEVGKWFRRACNAFWWEVNATSTRYRSEKRQANWRADAITWSEHNTEPFAGLHNLRKRILLIFDEASAIADKVYEVAEGAMTDEETEIIWLAFGNPTQNTGRFRECFGKFKHRWKTFQIDSRTVEGTNKAQLQKWVEDYGEDSDFVRVRVRGEFPRSGSSQFIPSDIVEQCRRYKASGFEQLPKILSVDVARYGDDQAVIGTRQGRKAKILAKYRGLSTVQLAERTIEFIKSESPDATIVDGIGVGAGVVDQLKYRGYTQKLFEYAPNGTAEKSAAYFNRRAELWGLMRDWLQAGAEIPDDPELAADLTGPEYYFSSKSQIQLESKDDMKARGLSSPDCADMLAQTFQVKINAPAKQPERPQYRYPGQDNLSWMEA